MESITTTAQENNNIQTQSRPPARSKDDWARFNYYNILGASKQIIQLSGLDALDADTILAIAACMRGPAVDMDKPQKKITRAAIGAKLSIRSTEPESLTKAVSRRLKRLHKNQAKIGREFIEQTEGRFHSDTNKREASTFTDFLTPAAQAAIKRFDEKKKAMGAEWERLSPEDKALHFDEIAQAALDAMIPTPKPPEQTNKKPGLRLSVGEYQIHFGRTFVSVLNKGIGKLAEEYQDPGAALSALEHAQADLLKVKYSLLKLNPGLRRNQTFPSFPREADSLPDLTFSEETGGPDKMSGGGGEERMVWEDRDIRAGAQAEILPALPESALLEPNQGDKMSGERPEDPAQPGGQNVPGFPLILPADLHTSENRALLDWAEVYLNRWGAFLLNYGLRPGGSCACPQGPACTNQGKHPWGGSGNILRTVEDVAKGLKKIRWGNAGLPTGPETFTALDFDGEAGRALLARWEEEGLVPAGTLRATTGGGGRHLIITYQAELLARVKGLQGLDIRNKGGNIIVAPSLHRSGNLYHWDCFEHPVLNPGPELLAILKEAFQSQPLARRGEDIPKARASRIAGTRGPESPDFYLQGERNDRLFRVAAGKRGAGAPFEEIDREVHFLNLDRCIPPLEAEEVNKIVHSAWNRYVPETAKGGRV